MLHALISLDSQIGLMRWVGQELLFPSERWRTQGSKHSVTWSRSHERISGQILAWDLNSQVYALPTWVHNPAAETMEPHLLASAWLRALEVYFHRTFPTALAEGSSIFISCNLTTEGQGLLAISHVVMILQSGRKCRWEGRLSGPLKSELFIVNLANGVSSMKVVWVFCSSESEWLSWTGSLTLH